MKGDSEILVAKINRSAAIGAAIVTGLAGYGLAWIQRPSSAESVSSVVCAREAIGRADSQFDSYGRLVSDVLALYTRSSNIEERKSATDRLSGSQDRVQQQLNATKACLAGKS